MPTFLLAVLSSVLMLAGLAGIFLPFIPGVPLAWLGFFIFAFGTGFDRISLTTTIVFFVIMLLTAALDFLASMIGAKKYGASKWGVIGASLGLLVGFLIFGFWGIILGPFIGTLVGEMIARKGWVQALKPALGTFFGFLAGTLLKIVVVLIMIGFFIRSWF